MHLCDLHQQPIVECVTRVQYHADVHGGEGERWERESVTEEEGAEQAHTRNSQHTADMHIIRMCVYADMDVVLGTTHRVGATDMQMHQSISQRVLAG